MQNRRRRRASPSRQTERQKNYWRLRYRYRATQKMLALDPYPAISLLDARARRDEAKRLLVNGIDPSDKRKDDKAAARLAAGTTFGLVAGEFIERMCESALRVHPSDLNEISGLRCRSASKPGRLAPAGPGAKGSDELRRAHMGHIGELLPESQ